MRAAAGLAALLATLAVVAQAGGATKPKPEEVAVQFSAYGPSQLDVLPGKTVRWSNVSPRTHTVTSDTGVFDSGHLGPGDSFDFTFNQPGRYQYHCTIHSSILGALLTFSRTPWYGAYGATTRAWGLTPIEDQQLGGLIMWVPAGLVYLTAGLLLFAAWIRVGREGETLPADAG